jgi:hypothetical protein
MGPASPLGEKTPVWGGLRVRTRHLMLSPPPAHWLISVMEGAELDAMIAACHPQALLVYTSVGEHLRVNPILPHASSKTINVELELSLW